MNITIVLIGFAAILGIYFVYKFFFEKPSGEKVIVSYSEQIKGHIVEHENQYDAYMDDKKDILKIPKLNLERPVPQRKWIMPTNKGGKKVFILKFENGRYGYRTPSARNEIMLFDRDENGKILKNKNGSPKIILHRWALCEDVVEPDVKHWEENMQDWNKKRHAARDSALLKWAGPISLAMIFLLAIIGMQQLSKQWESVQVACIDSTTQKINDADRISGKLDDLLQKVTGTKVLDTSKQDREEYYIKDVD